MTAGNSVLRAAERADKHGAESRLLDTHHTLTAADNHTKGKVFPYSLPSIGPGADPGVQAVSPQVT